MTRTLFYLDHSSRAWIREIIELAEETPLARSQSGTRSRSDDEDIPRLWIGHNESHCEKFVGKGRSAPPKKRPRCNSNRVIFIQPSSCFNYWEPLQKFMKHYRWLFGREVDFSGPPISVKISLHDGHWRYSIPQLGVAKSFQWRIWSSDHIPTWKQRIWKSSPEIRFFRWFWRGLLSGDIGATTASALLGAECKYLISNIW
jgi:hypothetical protein